jgi:antitoxin VapB
MQRSRAKVFTNGGSQAIRLPKRFRVETKEVEIWREGDELRLRPVEPRRFSGWDEMFAAIDRRGSDMTIEGREQPAEADVRLPFDDD